MIQLFYRSTIFIVLTRYNLDEDKLDRLDLSGVTVNRIYNIMSVVCF